MRILWPSYVPDIDADLQPRRGERSFGRAKIEVEEKEQNSSEVKVTELKFDRNENVAIAENAPAKFRPSAVAWMISGRMVENELQAQAVGYPVNTILYLVEYADGSDVEIPGEFLRHP